MCTGLCTKVSGNPIFNCGEGLEAFTTKRAEISIERANHVISAAINSTAIIIIIGKGRKDWMQTTSVPHAHAIDALTLLDTSLSVW